jgi:hypothetical protein
MQAALHPIGDSNLARRDIAAASQFGYSPVAAFLQIIARSVSNAFKKEKQYEINRKQHDAKRVF